MDIERENVVEIVASVSVVFVLLGAMYWIGLTYGGNDGGLTPEGGQMLVGTIVGFILLMTAVGVGLAYALNDPEDGLESEEDDAEAADAEAKSAA